MAVLKLFVLSALLAAVSSSPLASPANNGNHADTIPRAAPAVAGGAIPAPPRPTPIVARHGTAIARDPEPAETGQADIVRRLDIGPAATPAPSPSGDVTVSEGCTSTFYPGKVATPCSWDGTRTIWPYTTTLYRSADCHGCSYLSVVGEWYFCPNMKINGTREVSTPSTYWSTVCASSARVIGGGGQRPQAPTATADMTLLVTESAAAIDLQARAGGNRERAPQAGASACPTTYVIQPEKSAGKTSTTYQKFTTTTVLLNCKGCSLTLSTALAGYGPANGFTQTTTLPVGTATTYACYN